MKKVKIILIIILCGLLFFLSGILVWALFGSTGKNTAFSTERSYSINPNFDLVLEKEVETASISSLDIQYDINDVFFYENTDNTILIKEYMNYTPKKEQISTVEQQGNALIIKGKKQKTTSSFLFGVDTRKAYTEIYLPANFYTALSVKTVSGDIRSERDFLQSSAFSASSTSGDIHFPKVEADNIELSSTSGELTLEQALATSIQIGTVSGDILLKYAEGKTHISTTSGNIRIPGGKIDQDINTVSGDINISDTIGVFKLSTTSGDISINGAQGYGKTNTVSGDVRIFLDELNGNLGANTTSGNVDINIPTNASFSLDFSSTSGKCSTFFDDVLSFNKKGTQAKGQYGTANDTSVTVSTVSGDLKITEKH